ncbi:hypothetical protein BJX96DRAFT_112350 [Aspergillus floccosus]
MARVSRRPVSAFARRASSRAAHKTARRHKVIMESITQEKKKLRSVISFEAKAPPGYTFIPAGNPQLTTACKELCRKDGLKIFAVSTTPHMHTHNLSQHVHRIGYHFPSAVVANVCMELGVYLTATGKAVPFQEINNAPPRKRADSEVSQITINTEARDVLKDLFPNIPDNDLNQIIKTAFQKGQRKVGTAVELPLARRAQLAVVAHIRHVYTNYDKLLKMTSFHEARSLVEEHTLAKLVEWRGDDENGKTVLEDVFREVIVISDDDDSDAEEDVPKPSDRDYSIEVISSQPRVEVLQTQPVNPANSGLQDLSEDDVPSGFRVIPRDTKRSKVDRRGFSRYQAWDRAINRYRNVAMRNNQQGSHIPPRDPNPPYGTGQSLQAPVELDLDHFPQRVSRPRHVSVPSQGVPNKRSSGPGNAGFNSPVEHHQQKLFSVAESPYEQPSARPSNIRPQGQSSPHHGNQASNRRGDSPNAPVFVSGPKEVLQKSMDYPGHYSRNPGPSFKENTSKLQDHVLPSIEAPLPVERQAPEAGALDHLAKRMSGGFSIRSMTPHHATNQDSLRTPLEITSTGEQAPKRRRMAYPHPVPNDDLRYIPGPSTTLVEPYAGTRYVPVGRSLPGEPAQDGAHIRRRYAAPVLPSSSVELPPRPIFADPHYRPRYDFDAQPASIPPRPPVSANLHHPHRAPERVLAAPMARYPVLVDENYKALAPVSTSGLREPLVYHSTNRPSVEKLPSLPMHGELERTRTNGVILPHETLPKRHYADDFVRAVDIREPILMESPPRTRPQASHVAGARGLPVTASPRDRYQHELPSKVTSRLPERPHSGRVRSTVYGHTAAENLSPRSHVHTLPGHPPSSRHYERRRDDPFDSTRPVYEVHHPTPTALEPPRPVYVRALDRPPLQSTLPEERRPIIIVD